VPCVGGEDLAERDLASFGVDAGAGQILGAERAQPAHGEPAVGLERGEDLVEIELFRGKPGDERVLVVGDEKRLALRGDASHPVRGGEIAVEEMDRHFLDAPGARADPAVRLLDREAVAGRAQQGGAAPIRGDRRPQVGGIGWLREA